MEDINESWFQPGNEDAMRRIIHNRDPRIAAAVKKTNHVRTGRFAIEVKFLRGSAAAARLLFLKISVSRI